MEPYNSKARKRKAAAGLDDTPDPPREIVTSTNPHDILLGRGAPTAYFEGNVAFRALVSARKAEYMSSGRHKRKQEIAQEIFDEIAARGGRFLSKVETVATNADAEVALFGLEEGQKAWYVASASSAMEKIKQSLRDGEAAEDTAAAAAAQAAAQASAIAAQNPNAALRLSTSRAASSAWPNNASAMTHPLFGSTSVAAPAPPMQRDANVHGAMTNNPDNATALHLLLRQHNQQQQQQLHPGNLGDSIGSLVLRQQQQQQQQQQQHQQRPSQLGTSAAALLDSSTSQRDRLALLLLQEREQQLEAQYRRQQISDLLNRDQQSFAGPSHSPSISSGRRLSDSLLEPRDDLDALEILLQQHSHHQQRQQHEPQLGSARLEASLADNLNQSLPQQATARNPNINPDGQWQSDSRNSTSLDPLSLLLLEQERARRAQQDQLLHPQQQLLHREQYLNSQRLLEEQQQQQRLLSLSTLTGGNVGAASDETLATLFRQGAADPNGRSRPPQPLNDRYIELLHQQQHQQEQMRQTSSVDGFTGSPSSGPSVRVLASHLIFNAASGSGSGGLDLSNRSGMTAASAFGTMQHDRGQSETSYMRLANPPPSSTHTHPSALDSFASQPRMAVAGMPNAPTTADGPNNRSGMDESLLTALLSRHAAASAASSIPSGTAGLPGMSQPSPLNTTTTTTALGTRDSTADGDRRERGSASSGTEASSDEKPKARDTAVIRAATDPPADSSPEASGSSASSP